MKRLRFLVGFLAACGMVIAADIQPSGPLTGIVYTPASRSLRPILGYPGAAYLGASLVNGVDWAAVSPGGDRALVRGGESLRLIDGLRSGNLRSRQLSPPEGDVLAAWSDASDALAILYRQEQRLRVLTFDGGSEREMEAPAGTVRGLAISAGGDLVLVAVEDAIWQIPPGEQRRIPLSGTPTSVAFARNGKDALALDDSGTRLHWIQDVRGTAAVVPVVLSGAASAITDAGGGRVLVLDSTRRRAWLVDLASGQFSAETQLDWAPESALPLAQPFLFLAGGGRTAGDPVYILSTRGRLDAFFIPNTPE